MNYHERADAIQGELDAVTYYLIDFYSFAEPPDEAYIQNMKEAVKNNTSLTPASRSYIFAATGVTP